MKPTNFAVHLTSFISEYLPARRNVSSNTVKAYRDVFTLLLRYFRDVRQIAPERLTLERIDVPQIIDFLSYIERERHCAARTRNHRLAALHAFFRYLQSEEPSCIAQCQRIMAIPFQRFQRTPVNYLTPEYLTAILAQPNLATIDGRRDAVLLSVLYDTGARVKELIDLSVCDVRLVTPAQILLHGKGRKMRVVPLLSGTVNLLDEYIHEHRLERSERQSEPLFCNRRNERLSRSGVNYILSKYTLLAGRDKPGMPIHISPHTLRHTKAMHLLQAGNPITTIQAILGHADIKTSSIYATADLDMKRKALEKASGNVPTPNIESWRNDKGLLEWLRAL